MAPRGASLPGVRPAEATPAWGSGVGEPIAIWLAMERRRRASAALLRLQARYTKPTGEIRDGRRASRVSPGAGTLCRRRDRGHDESARGRADGHHRDGVQLAVARSATGAGVHCPARADAR